MIIDENNYNCVECEEPAWIEADGKYLCRGCYQKLKNQRLKRINKMIIPDDVIANGVDDYPPLDGFMPNT